MTGKKILIIDDDPHLLLGLTARLKAHGYKVICATDALSAMTVARKETPDLIILDLGLPGGDGFLVLERMRGLTDLVATPVIVLSARDPGDNRKRALDAGAVAFFQKPPDNHGFLTSIRQALGETIALSTFLKT
jgi:two-component system, OmpR family, KDP operon response regulator KdpE